MVSLTPLTARVYALVTAMQSSSYDTDPEEEPGGGFGAITQAEASIFYDPDAPTTDQAQVLDELYQKFRDEWHEWWHAPFLVNVQYFVDTRPITHCVRVNRPMDVEDLKVKIAPLFHVPVEQQQLVHRDVLMESGQCLWYHYQVMTEDIIILLKTCVPHTHTHAQNFVLPPILQY